MDCYAKAPGVKILVRISGCPGSSFTVIVQRAPKGSSKPKMFAKRRIWSPIFVQEAASLRMERLLQRRDLQMLWEEGYPEWARSTDHFGLRRLFGESPLRVELDEEDWG